MQTNRVRYQTLSMRACGSGLYSLCMQASQASSIISKPADLTFPDTVITA